MTHPGWTRLHVTSLALNDFPRSRNANDVQARLERYFERPQQRPHGSLPYTERYVWKVMKPTLLHRVAAPSPSVLSFLRTQVTHAFERPLAQCAQVAPQRRRYGTNIRAQSLSGDTSCRANIQGSKRRQRAGSRTFATSRPLFETSLVASRTTALSVRDVDAQGHRSFSTTSPNNAWNIFNPAKLRKMAQLQPPQPPPDETSSGATGFGSSLGRIMRPTNELKMRCTELDEHGNVTLVSGEFKKSELIAKVRTAMGLPRLHN
jgi:magnesium transporter